MKLLVTGANGFVGSYFVEHYKSNYDIQAFSFSHDDFESLDLNGIELIIHLSALVHQVAHANEAKYRKINVAQTLGLAKKAKLQGVSHFIFMSSVKVYGEETDKVLDEHSPCNPKDAYGKSKLEAEKALQSLEDENFKVSIIRTPIVYGKGVKANFSSLIRLIKKVPLLPFRGIKNRRSIVYIGNLSAIIDQIVQTRESGIFLASDESAVSTSELIELIASALHKKIYLFTIPFFSLLLKVLKPALYQRLYQSLEIDNTLTKERLSFSNPFSMEQGIKNTIDQGDTTCK